MTVLRVPIGVGGQDFENKKSVNFKMPDLADMYLRKAKDNVQREMNKFSLT